MAPKVYLKSEPRSLSIIHVKLAKVHQIKPVNSCSKKHPCIGEGSLQEKSNTDIPDLQDIDYHFWFTKYSLKFIDYLSSYEDIINMGKPLYKQGKYAFGTGGFEAVIDGVIYGLNDRWDTSLSPTQRLSRIGVVSAEAFAVDVVSQQIGNLGNLIGGVPGKIGTQYLSSAVISDKLLPFTTNWFFSNLGLGLPFDLSPIAP